MRPTTVDEDSFQPHLFDRLGGYRAHRRAAGPDSITALPSAVQRAESPLSYGGGTETEDEPHPLPTSRIATPQHLATPSPLLRLVPVVIFAFRMLSVVPAVLGACWHFWNLYHPPAPTKTNPNGRVDYILSILWAILTAHQCLSLTNGLLHRWRCYYTLLPTLIRLLALQAICWPATHFTLRTFDHSQRPLICWTIIGTTTCISKAIQLWVTSNLRASTTDASTGAFLVRFILGELKNGPDPGEPNSTSGRKEDSSGKVKKRKWDWSQVVNHCIVPPGIIYVLMAWALVLRREFEQSC